MVVRQRKEEKWRVVVRFEGDGGVKGMDPVKLTKIIGSHV